LCSDAARTSETLWAMTNRIGAPPSELLPSLYGAGIEGLVHVVKRLPDEVHTVLVLGHNPGWSQAASWLCGEALSLSPANAVLLSAVGSRWTDVLGAGGLQLRDVLKPSAEI
jgi:phosphohistidine phosphatase